MSPACICAEYDGKGRSTCGVVCPEHGPAFTIDAPGTRLANYDNLPGGKKWWAISHRKKIREGIAWYAVKAKVEAGRKPLEYARVVITYSHKQTMDDDGLASACKPVVDGLKGHCIVDDTPDRIERELRQVKGPYGLRIEVYPRQPHRGAQGRGE